MKKIYSKPETRKRENLATTTAQDVQEVIVVLSPGAPR